ncbi:hypothetical protein RPQ02_40215 [Streptomyces sp. AM2-3-1]|uniref:hypothetical protein n=1 Tax=Streptomyces sp. AM2-3-1 TaxID=3075824 RepID=UPI0028C4EE4A|nr:hypothetical protein [Streptomyces sp. AM2-3-1]WNO62407.1 hypothetical protein RPQ02_00565 [Streptomyces sp. AM2-3-1]WNO69539.1 hypothetical protein RPQ02_40215 [Streptomyces sp. AM2-3-1]
MTFRTLERRRQAVCLAMEQQARRTAAARLKSAEASRYADEDELKRLLQLTQELFRALRAAEDALPTAEAIKAATSRYTARVDQIATECYNSLPVNGDGAYAERHALNAARQRLEQP